MLATIAKQFTFHAAHRLPNHDGPCRELHGHSYTLEVMVTGLVKPTCGDPDEGMVMDFGLVKEVYKFCIEPHVEHKFLNESLANICYSDGSKWLPHTQNPDNKEGKEEPLTTCEAIATWMWHMFDHELPRRTAHERSVCVRLWETPTSYAEVGKSPWRG